ncbi:MAG: hypothetical protein NCA08_02040 [Deltaproteobacteria bacterium]|nr:hypothetical protein [Candidatus Deferrimicrobium borealis]
MKNVTKHLLWVGILAALALPAFAETRTIFWNPITTYTDGTPFETGKTITYSVYWTTDPGLASLHTIGTSLATTSTTFDPGVQGMTRGGTVYFTGKAVLNTGEESALSPAFAWVVPVVTPPPPPPPTATLTSVTVTGPTSVNEGGTATYTATGRWDDGTTAAVSPTWTENSTFATITSGGVLTASAVTANQTVTVTATYGGRTGTMNVTIVNAAGVLASVTVTGPTSVNEGGTATYTATGRWDDGTTAAVSPTWTENSTFATITSGGVLTASAVTANQTVTVTATYGGRTGTMNVTIVNAAGVLASVTVTGPTSVNEGGTATYTATGRWDDGTTAAVTPTWTENSTFATITSGGVLTASAVTANQTVTVTATYGGRTGTMNVTIVNAAGVLASVAVSGPTSVNEGGTGSYTATGTWDNGTTAAISPTWTEDSTYATITSGGVLTASAVTANQTVTVTATYGGRTGTMSVTIVDAPGTAPAAAKNIGITGPISSGTAQVWRLAWDPVTTYANNAPFEAGRTVRYTVYWTDDPALSAGSLRQLASSVSTTAVEFNPVAQQMPVNRPAWLTVRSVLDTGTASTLAASIEWVVANTGPTPPVGGIIIRK